jgi:hypothetical protein
MRHIHPYVIAVLGFFLALAAYVIYRVFFSSHIEFLDVVFAAWFGGVASVVLFDAGLKYYRAHRGSRPRSGERKVF